MIAPEIMRAFAEWWSTGTNGRAEPPIYPSECYPLYIGRPLSGQWHVRERYPGVRIWRAEENGTFTRIDAEALHAARIQARMNAP